MNIDDIFDKAKSAVNVAAKKTEEVVEVSRLKFESAKLNNELAGVYEKLGHAVYEAKKGNYENNDLVESLCEDIDTLLADLDRINNDIADKKNQVICPTCGASNVKESIYCSKCGTKVKSEFETTVCEEETSTAEDVSAETETESSAPVEESAPAEETPVEETKTEE